MVLLFICFSTGTDQKRSRLFLFGFLCVLCFGNGPDNRTKESELITLVTGYVHLFLRPVHGLRSG